MSAALADVEDARVVVRMAMPHMLTEMMRYSREAFEASNYATHGFHATQWRSVLREAMLDKSMCVISAWRGQRCVGLLVGMMAPMPWCLGFAATDIVFVAEQGGDMMLRQFVDWARARKCKRIDMGVSDDAILRMSPERIGKLYDRMFAAAGFHRAGGVYFMQGDF